MEFTQAAGHRNWSTARKNRARDRAALIGDVARKADGTVAQFAVAGAGTVTIFAFLVGAVEVVERLIP